MSRWLSYIDRGRPGPRYENGGALVLMKGQLPQLIPRKLPLEELRRHNALEPELQDTDRVFLRWSECEGSGLPNPEADVRETHYDPLPLEIQQWVSGIVARSSWFELIRKLYLTNLRGGSIAEQLGISRAQFNVNRRVALWYFKGRFEAENLPMLASAKLPRASNDLW